MKRFLSSLVVTVGLFGAGQTLASKPFTGKISEVMPCLAQCTLCHNDATGGPGNLNPFGATMLSRGLLAPKIGDPVAALNRLGDADTDMDGAFDVDEVRAGTNPSKFGDASVCGPQYGCGAHIARPASHGIATGVGAFTALALGAIALRRRAKR